MRHMVWVDGVVSGASLLQKKGEHIWIELFRLRLQMGKNSLEIHNIYISYSAFTIFPQSQKNPDDYHPYFGHMH